MIRGRIGHSRSADARVRLAQHLRATVAYYKALTGGRCSLHFRFPERGLELASVSSPAASFLIIAGIETAVAPFRATALTVLVDDIAAVAGHVEPLGAVVVQAITSVRTGYQTRVRHPDGLLVEYVQHNEAADRFRDTDLQPEC